LLRGDLSSGLAAVFKRIESCRSSIGEPRLAIWRSVRPMAITHVREWMKQHGEAPRCKWRSQDCNDHWARVAADISCRARAMEPCYTREDAPGAIAPPGDSPQRRSISSTISRPKESQLLACVSATTRTSPPHIV